MQQKTKMVEEVKSKKTYDLMLKMTEKDEIIKKKQKQQEAA